MDDHRKVLGSRIRDARVRLSFTQETLARETGLSSAQLISQIEKGEREVKAWELFNLAKALFLDISQLATIEEAPPIVPVLWRESPSADKEVIEAEFLKRCRQYAMVERLCGCVMEKSLPTKKLNLNSMNFSDANKLGEQIWSELQIGSRPACALESMLGNDYGIKIWYKNLGEDGSAAAAKGPFGAAMLINSQEAPWRRNFSIGHELFHLITWEDTTKGGVSEERVEKLANAFSSALLLPMTPLREAFEPRIKTGKVENSDLIEVARQFDVSTSALVYRLINLGWVEREEMEKILGESTFKSQDRTSRMGKWLQPPAIPERFVRLAFLAYQKGNLSRARLAEYLNVSISEVGDILQEYGLNEEIDYQAEVRAS
jgi:Zn-dependent peptidase ImmA (M78 family)/transcriptional regulator with XRE-family HTH domain